MQRAGELGATLLAQQGARPDAALVRILPPGSRVPDLAVTDMFDPIVLDDQIELIPAELPKPRKKTSFGKEGVTLTTVAPHVLDEGRDEQHLSRFPMVVLDPRHSKTLRRLESTFKYRGGDNIVREGIWRIIASPEHGLPHRGDVRFVTILLQLAFEQKSQWIEFTFYELLRRANYSNPSGKDYNRLRDLLETLKSTEYQADYLFVPKQGNQDTETHSRKVAFNIISEYDMATNAGSATRESRVRISDTMWRQVSLGGTHAISMRTLLALSDGLPQSLYRFLEAHRLDKKPMFRIELMKLASHLSIQSARYASEVERHLKRAHAELLALGYLEEAHAYTNPEKDRIMFYRFGDDRREGTLVVDQLIDYQIHRGVALRLLKDYGREEVERHLAAYLLVQKLKPYTVKIPGAWIVAAIKNGWMHVEITAEAELTPQPSFDLSPVDTKPRKPEKNFVTLTERYELAREVLGMDLVMQIEEAAMAEREAKRLFTTNPNDAAWSKVTRRLAQMSVCAFHDKQREAAK